MLSAILMRHENVEDVVGKPCGNFVMSNSSCNFVDETIFKHVE